MKRVQQNQRGHRTMLGAISALIPAAMNLLKIGLGKGALAEMAMNARVAPQTYDNWRHAPFGKSGGGVAINRRKAKKRASVIRARARGQA